MGDEDSNIEIGMSSESESEASARRYHARFPESQCRSLAAHETDLKVRDCFSYLSKPGD